MLVGKIVPVMVMLPGTILIGLTLGMLGSGGSASEVLIAESMAIVSLISMLAPHTESHVRLSRNPISHRSMQ